MNCHHKEGLTGETTFLALNEAHQCLEILRNVKSIFCWSVQLVLYTEEQLKKKSIFEELTNFYQEGDQGAVSCKWVI